MANSGRSIIQHAANPSPTMSRHGIPCGVLPSAGTGQPPCGRRLPAKIENFTFAYQTAEDAASLDCSPGGICGAEHGAEGLGELPDSVLIKKRN